MAPPAEKNKHRILRKIWICADVLMDIFPFFDRPQLGLKLALLSPRFDALVDAHFDAKTELTLWKLVRIRKGIGKKPKLFVWIGVKLVQFELPDRPLRDKLRFNDLRIGYIDHSVVTFLRANKHIWDRGINLNLSLNATISNDCQPILDVLVREIWPIFTTSTNNKHHFGFSNGAHLDTLLHLTSPSILSDLNINSINSGELLPEVIGDVDGPNATPSAGQMLSKWLHIPTTDGRPKRLFCRDNSVLTNLEWVNSFKGAFSRATTTSSASYIIHMTLYESTPTEPFQLVNKRTKEKLTLMKKKNWPLEPGTSNWLLKRCPLFGQKAAVQRKKDENSDANLNNVNFYLWDGNISIGPLSLPAKRRKRRV